MPMPQLEPFLLAVSPHSKEENLRRNLEDCLKEYSELDLLIEVVQNALDAIDLKRYRLICGVLGRDPEAADTVHAWNRAVNACIQRDFDEYDKAETPSRRATLYRAWHDEPARRDAWWATVAESFEFDKATLIPAVGALGFAPVLKIVLDRRAGQSVWLEVIENGIGIEDIVRAFTHQSSTKRTPPTQTRRLGIRGNHGWGLTAVLGMSDLVVRHY